jgi:sec-independent protein translocase protein TatB
MIDISFTKIALIGAVALVVIGPEKLPRLARTVGALLGKAQRYVSDVKAEVNRTMDLEELNKMRETVEGAARDVESSMTSTAQDFEKSWAEATDTALSGSSNSFLHPVPDYRVPKKRWRTKVDSIPNWYKARHGTRKNALSGAARVARYRPKKAT